MMREDLSVEFISCLLSLAKVDGHISEEEKKVIGKYTANRKLSSDEKQQLKLIIDGESNPVELFQRISEVRERKMIVDICSQLINADQNLSVEEEFCFREILKAHAPDSDMKKGMDEFQEQMNKKRDKQQVDKQIDLANKRMRRHIFWDLLFW